MPLTNPAATLRNLNRYREIVAVLVKYGFGEIVARLNLYTAYRVGQRLFRRPLSIERSYAERIRMALEELGPTFIKLGQILSMRPFLIPAELAIELTKLQDQVPPVDATTAINAVETSLGRKIGDMFLEFDPLPIASASLSQVHNAVLPDGARVVVKIQRPGIKRIIDADMIILRDIANLLEKRIPESRQYEPIGLVNELARSTRREINFLYEARNIEIFARNFKDESRIYIPNVYWNYTARHILTMDRVEGVKINEITRLREMGLDTAAICRAGGDMVFKMIFNDGFFHADPHPGNLFVLPDGRIAPVDYGMVGTLSGTQLNQLADILMAIVSNDPAMVIYSFAKTNAIPEDTSKSAVEADINELITRYHKVPLSRIDMAAISDEFFEIAHRHNIRIQSEFMVFGKALVTYEEVARQLDPGYDFIKEARPFVRKLAFHRFGPKRLQRDFRMITTELYDILLKLPTELNDFTRKLNKGRIKVGLEVHGLEKLILELDKSSNRLSFALIIAAIIVGSSMIMTLDVGIKIYGLPALGLFGYLFAGILGAGLAISILRSGRL